MRISLAGRITLAIAPILILAALALGAVVRQQTVAQFIVYLSSQEQLDRLDAESQQQVRIRGVRIAGLLARADAAGVPGQVNALASAVGRDVVVARNQDQLFASRQLDGAEMLVSVNEFGALVGSISDARRGIAADIELLPTVSVEITPFVVEDETVRDVARVYLLPDLVRFSDASQQQFVRRTTAAIAAVTGLAALMMIALIAVVLGRSLAPLQTLTSAAARVQWGELPGQVPVNGTREIISLVSAFNSMTDSLASAEATRRRYLTDISHELRGPLTNLRAQIEAMQDGLVQADSGSLRSIHADTLHLARLVDDLHVLTLADSDSVRLEMDQLNLSDLAEAMVESHAPAAADAGTALTFAGSPGLTVRADAQRLDQVVRNVLENSLKYAAGGTVAVTVRSRGAEAVLEIADTGPGVPTDELERIFDRFYRTDPSRSRESGGTGLGLSIARSLIVAQNGSITAAPREPHGLSVTIALPAHTPAS